MSVWDLLKIDGKKINELVAELRVLVALLRQLMPALQEVAEKAQEIEDIVLKDDP